MPLKKSMARPFLESCVQLWSHYYKNDRVELEKLQKSAIKIRLLNGFFGKRA